MAPANLSNTCSVFERWWKTASISIYIYIQRDLSLKGETWWMLEQAWQKILLRSRDRITPLCGAALIRIHPKYLPLSFPSRNDKMPCKFILLKQTKQPIDRLSDYSGYSLYFFYSKQWNRDSEIIYDTLDDADNFGAEKEERRSRKTFEGGENKSLKKRNRRRRRTKGNKREREEWKRNEKERGAGYNYLGDRIRPPSLPSLSPPARSRAWRQQSANALMETSVIRVYSLCTSNYPFPRVESRSCPRMEGGLPSGEQGREERGSRR